MNDNPFETRAREYDAWYDRFPNLFRSEVLAVRALLPPPGRWVEVGVGTGRFAAELGIHLGVEPADAMAVLARNHGIEVIDGHAEALPLGSESVDAVFFITTLCFVKDLNLALCEALRILRPGGCCIVALLPLDSPLGQITHTHASEDVFLQIREVEYEERDSFEFLRGRGDFTVQQTVQTFALARLRTSILRFKYRLSGHDRGSFIVILLLKKLQSIPLVATNG